MRREKERKIYLNVVSEKKNTFNKLDLNLKQRDKCFTKKCYENEHVSGCKMLQVLDFDIDLNLDLDLDLKGHSLRQ